MKDSKVKEPEILTAKTYFWSSAGNASQRRRNEEKNQSEVASFFESIGMEVTRKGDNVIGKAGAITAIFHYSESCNNVYSSLSVHNGEKKSNIRLLRKYY